MLLLRLVMFSIIALPFREAYREGKYAAYPLVVDYNENYYYKTLREKMIESLSISNCLILGKSLKKIKRLMIYIVCQCMIIN